MSDKPDKNFSENKRKDQQLVDFELLIVDRSQMMYVS